MRFEKIGRHTAKETSDRKPVGLPFRLKELRTFACFPVSQQGSINYPPSASRMGPLSLQNRKRAACFPFAELLHTCFFKREHSASLLQSTKIAPSRESVRIRTDSKHSLRLFDMSFLLVTRLLNSRVCLFCTVSSRRLAAFVFYLSFYRLSILFCIF